MISAMNPNANPLEEATAYLAEAAQHRYYSASGSPRPLHPHHASHAPVPWSSDPVGMSIAADADIYPSLFVDTSDDFLGTGNGSGLDSAGSYGTHSLLSTSPGSGSGGDDMEMGRADLNFTYLPHNWDERQLHASDAPQCIDLAELVGSGSSSGSPEESQELPLLPMVPSDSTESNATVVVSLSQSSYRAAGVDPNSRGKSQSTKSGGAVKNGRGRPRGRGGVRVRGRGAVASRGSRDHNHSSASVFSQDDARIHTDTDSVSHSISPPSLFSTPTLSPGPSRPAAVKSRSGSALSIKSAQANAGSYTDVSPSFDADDDVYANANADADADGESELDDASSTSDADEYREEEDEAAHSDHSSAASSDYFPARQRRAARTRARSGNRFHPYGNGGSLVSVGAGAGVGGRGRRPGSPVPVPSLTKTSRGRKVPVVPRALSPSQARLSSATDDADGHERAGPSPRKSTGGGGAGERTFRCAVGECGKCFIRAEHLKRHIRSIHTDEKPHPCPKKGCDRSFSRRDNLGQHLRVHGLKL